MSRAGIPNKPKPGQADQVDPMWRDKAGCLGADPEMFFPDADDDRSADALAHCRRCPVVEACDAFAVRNRLEGVWGGKVRGPHGTFATKTCATCGIAVRPQGAKLRDYPGTRMYMGNGDCQTCFRAAKARAYDAETERLLAAIHEQEATV